MNHAIATIWKYLNGLRGTWRQVAQVSLGVVALILIAMYLVWRFPAIITRGETQIDTAAIALGVIIVLMPFLAEIELFGVKFKKEIEAVKRETDAQIQSLKQQLLILQSQQQIVNVQQRISIIDPKELQATRQAIQETVQLHPSRDANRVFRMPEEIKLVLATQYNIKKKMGEMILALEAHTEPRLTDALTELTTRAAIDEHMSQAIAQILLIGDMAQDGEEIVDIQYDFVKDTAPSIVSYLEDRLSILKDHA